MRKKVEKEIENKKNNMKSSLILIIAVIVVIILIIGGLCFYKSRKNNTENREVEAVVMYNINDGTNLILEDNSLFGTETTICWPEACSGIIKKDKKIISKENNTVLAESGVYEITVISPNKKNKTVRELEIDITPPEVTVEENEKVCVIVFKDINDVDKANLIRYDVETDELVEKIDLKQNGLKERIEVKDVGYYILQCTDNVGNTKTINFEL